MRIIQWSRLQRVVNAAHDAFFALDATGVVTDWSPAAQRVFGYTREEAVGRPPAELIVPPEAPELRRLLNPRRTRLVDRTIETRAKHRDGHEVPVEITVGALDGDGTAGLFALVHDLSEHRDLVIAQRCVGALFETSPNGVAVVAVDGTVVSANSAFARMLGCDPDAIVGQPLAAFAHEEDARATQEAVVRALAADGAVAPFERRFLRRGAAPVWACVSARAVRDDTGRAEHVVAQIEDISSRKRAEEELQRYAHELDALTSRDAATGLYNERELHWAIERRIALAEPHTVFTLVVLRAQHAGADPRRVGGALDRTPGEAFRLDDGRFALVLDGLDRGGAREVVAALEGHLGMKLTHGRADFPASADTKEKLLAGAQMPVEEEARVDAGAQIDRVLASAREHLGMDVAYYCEFTGDDQVVRGAAGDSTSFSLEVGAVAPLRDSFGPRMLGGEIEAGLGAYVGVPIRLSGGRLYGTLCAAGHDARPELGEHEASLLRILSDFLADALERRALEEDRLRLRGEATALRALLSALEARDAYTGKHSEDVVTLVGETARGMGLAEDRVEQTEQVALLHDVGKVGVPDAILQKRGPLDEREWSIMRRHPEIGERIVASIPSLAHLAAAVRAEHERWDGGGYPDKLSGEAIPLASRLVLACDAYHAMTSDRPYRAAMTRQKALAELGANAGTQFDPEVVAALCEVLDAAGALA